jgi:hypothetical protein
MGNVDWRKAPEGAEFHCCGQFYAHIDGALQFFDDGWSHSSFSLSERQSRESYEQRPQEWPEESRIDAISLNGATGEHYQLDSASGLIDAQDFLNEGLNILGERGRQYGSNERECSFPQVAQAFNAITGHSLLGSDVCLMLALVKQVRQYAQPERFHEDSAVDGVNYTALQAQELRKERKGESK